MPLPARIEALEAMLSAGFAALCNEVPGFTAAISDGTNAAIEALIEVENPDAAHALRMLADDVRFSR